MTPHQLNGNARSFVLAGNATVTLKSKRTGQRFTYKIKRKEVEEGRFLHFVSLLRGPDNVDDYSFLGTIFDGGSYRHGRKSRIGADAPSAVAFRWAFDHGFDHDGLEVWHEGSCGACGRALTVPESIESGFGPVCGGRS